MTRTTNARIAGFTFLFYIAAGITSMTLFPGGEGIAAKLAGVAQHATNVRVAFVVSLSTSFAALVLAVTLYALTRDQDHDLAMLALTCRVGEGLIGISIPVSLSLLWLATATGADTPDTVSAYALGAFLTKIGAWKTLISATFFAVGSTLFSYLFLRARSIPVSLAWLGVLASVLLVVGLPAQLAGLIKSPVDWFMWMPMLVFEIILALWLLIKSVAAPAT
jgi:hypothetical protein